MSRARWLIVLFLSIGIFVISTVGSMHDALAVLYVLAVLFIAQSAGPRAIVVAGVVYAVLSVVSFLIKHGGESFDDAYIRLGISLTAIMVATFLSRRAQLSRAQLAEQSLWVALTHDTVIIRDENDRIIDWNEGAARLYGWSRQEVLGRNVQSLLQTSFHGAHAPRLLPGDLWSGEIERRDRNGEQMILVSTWLGRVDENGRKGGVIELSADLTRERRAQADRLASNSRYQAIFNGAGIAIFEISTDAYGGTPHVQAQNFAADGLVGSTNQKGKPFLAMFNPEDGLQVHAALRDVVKTGIRQELSCTLFPSEQSGRDVLLTLSPGTCYGDNCTVLITAVDMTERNRDGARIEQMQAELAHASRLSALGQMTAVIAHEVNQPLMATVTFARSGRRWLRRSTPDLDEVAKCLDGIVNTGERASRVINRIRDMSRHHNRQYETIVLDRIIAETVEILLADFRRRAIDIESIDIDTNMNFSGDRIQIHQVLVNVMLNAAQAMEAAPVGNRTLSVKAEHDSSAGGIVLTIADTGPGFSQAVLKGGGVPFVTTKEDGVGLGLSVSQSIMENHGGSLRIANRTTGGGLVCLFWPLAKVKA